MSNPTAYGARSAALVCSTLVLLTAPSAVAAPTWLPSATLSGTSLQTTLVPQVAVDYQGEAIAIWAHSNGSTNIIEAAARPAGSGGWQAPVVLAGEGQSGQRPQLAFDPQGDAIAVWERPKGGSSIIEAAVRPAATDVWQAPVALSSEGQTANVPAVAVDPQGSAIAVWQRDEGADSLIEAAVLPTAGSAWQTPLALSAGGQRAEAPRVALDTHGDAVAVWHSYGAGAGSIVEAAVRPAASGAWQAPTRLSAAGENAYTPQVGVDPQGDTIAIWSNDTGSTLIAEAALRPAASGAWQAPVALSAPTDIAYEPQVALDAQGDAIAAWQSAAGEDSTIEAAARPAAEGTWQAPEQISPATAPEFGEFPQVALDPRGDAVAAWDQPTGAGYMIEAAARPAGGAWQAPTPLAPAGSTGFLPQVALDPQGNAVAVWERHGEGGETVEAAGYDAAGPLLHDLSIPSAGTVEQQLSFAVSPLDVWSALGATSWGFGDGAAASGATATHAYATAGSYTVTLSSADVLGNATTTTGTVVITGPPGPMRPRCKCRRSRPPAISDAHLTHRRFRVARRDTAISARAPRGTTFKFELSLALAAKLQIAITRVAAGLRAGHSCVAPTARLRRERARHCTRTLTMGTLTRAHERSGLDSVYFSGHIGGRPLNPGAYRAVLVASDAAGRSRPVTLAFAVVP